MQPYDFEEAIKRFLSYLQHVKGVSPHTLRNYAMDLQRFRSFAPELALVDKHAVRAYLAELARQGAARKSVVRRLSALRSFFRYLVREKICARNPIEEVESPKLGKTLPTVLSYAQVEHLFSLPDCRTYFGLRDRTLMELFYSSGLRISELVGIDRKDLDCTQRTLRVMGKGRKQRIVPLTENVCTWLLAYLEHPERRIDGKQRKAESDALAIFLNRWGKRMSVRSVDRLFKKYLLASGIVGHITPHTIRHTIATHWLEKGMNLKTIQLLLGHKTLTTTTIYTQVSSKLKREVYEETHPLAKKPGRR